MQQWLNILEASYLIFFLQPFHQSFNKRLIKMPKLYFYDTGLACTPLGLEKESQLETHYLKGALFENLIILEIFKKRLNKGLPAYLYFWRDRTGHEVDLLAEWGGYY
jgi:predicted AAA+ superfamily ATPase